LNPEEFGRVFPLGSHLCREPMPPMPEMKRDMELLKKHGFNLIKLEEHWMIDEPREGEYDFSRYEELIAHAAKLDLGVYLGLTCEQAPHWLYEKHPDCRMVRRDGVVVVMEGQTPVSGSDGKPGPCFDHPGAMSDQLRFISALVKTLGRFENVVVWDTWQEVGYWSEMLVGDHVCYCPHTLAAYRGWLRERYGDLDRLNAAWRSRYADWDDIQPERTHRSVPTVQETAWRTFMDNVQVANVLRARAEAVRAADPLKRPVFAHVACPAFGASQEWTYARTQDFFGTSCYPAWWGSGRDWDDGNKRPFERHHALLTEMWEGVAFRCDYIRSANPGQGHAGSAPVWAAEFQSGPVSTGFHKGRVPSREDIRRWMLTAAGSGVTGIAFWNARADIMVAEGNGFSLLDSVGDTTPRLEEAERIGCALNRHPELFAEATLPEAETGILVSEDNYQLCSALAQGGGNLAYSVRGWHRLLWESNVLMDFLSAEHDLDRLSRYKTLVFPFPLALSETLAARLARYVEEGGNLICEAAPGRVDENAFCNRGELSPSMAALFGVRQESFTMVREPDGGTRWSPPGRTWGEYLDAQILEGDGPLVGQVLRANVYLQTFDCLEGAEPVLRAGDAVAGVRRRVGKGQAWLLGTYIGHSGTAYRDPGIDACVRALLEACGARREHEGRLVLRKRVLPNKEAWILTNPTASLVVERIAAAGWAHVEDLLGGAVARKGDGVEVSVDPLDVRALVLSR